MIANIYNKTKPINIISIIVLLAVFFVVTSYMFNAEVVSLSYLLREITVFIFLVTFLLVLLFIIRKNKLTQDNSYGLLLVVLLLGTFYETLLAKKIIFISLTLLFAYRKIYSLRTGIRTKQILFDAGFWIAVSTLIYSWSIFYIVLIYIGILGSGKQSFKNFLIPLIGLIVPIFMFFTYCFYVDDLPMFYNRFLFEESLNYNAYKDPKLLIPIVFCILTLVLSIIGVSIRVAFLSKKIKLIWLVLLSHLAISVFIIGYSPVKNGSEMLFGIFPMAIIITNYIQKIESVVIKNAFLYLFLAVSMAVYLL